MDLSVPTTLLLCLVVFFAGLVDAIAGGGGLISLPAYLAVGLPPYAALATNKFSSTLGTLTAVVRYLRAGKLELRTGLLAAAGAVAGSAAGARLVLLVPQRAVGTIVLVLVPTALLVLLLLERFVRRAPTQQTPQPLPRRSSVKSLTLGVAVGLYDGFFGPGTGTFLTIGFHAALGLSLLVAAGNARLANLASNCGAVAVFLAGRHVLFPLAAYTAVAGVLGNQLGAALALRGGDRVVKPLLVLVLLVLLIQVARQQLG